MSYFQSGTWNLICDVCGKKIKAADSKKRWDGLIVCQKDFEFDHPQKFLRVRSDPKAVPYNRHEALDQFVTVNYADTVYVFPVYMDADYVDINAVTAPPATVEGYVTIDYMYGDYVTPNDDAQYAISTYVDQDYVDINYVE
jgi:hypothetical protein